MTRPVKPLWGEGNPARPRILFLGNASNIGIRYCLWFREHGADAELCPLDSDTPRSSPEGYFRDGVSEHHWIVPISLVGDPIRFAYRPGPARALIQSSYDLVVVTGRCGLVASRSLPLPRALIVNGSEVGSLPLSFFRAERRSGRKVVRGLVQAAAARSALRQMDVIFDSYLPNLAVLERLGLSTSVVPGTGGEDVTHNRALIDVPFRDALMKRYRDAHRIFMWFSRLNFQNPHDRLYKGAERFVKALKVMRSHLEDRSLRVVIGCHGEQAEEFVDLPEVRSVMPFIDWVDHLDYSQLLTYLSLPNSVLFSAFGELQVDFGGIDRDAATIGTVLVSSATDESMSRVYGTPAPLLHAVTPEEIARRMKEVFTMSPARFHQLQTQMAEFGWNCVDYSAVVPRMWQDLAPLIRRAG